MGDDSCDDQSTVQVLRIAGYQHESPDQEDKEDHDTDCSEESQFFADNGKDHVVLGFRHYNLLHALAKAFPKDSSGAYGIKSLKGLVSCVARVGLRVEPDKNTVTAEAHFGRICHADDISHARYTAHDTCHRQSYESLIIRAGHKNHAEGDGKDDQSGTQIVRQFPQKDRYDHCRYHRKQESPYSLQASSPYDFDQEGCKNDDRHFCRFRRLEGYLGSEMQPSPGSVDRVFSQGQQDQTDCDEESGNRQESPESVWNDRDQSHEHQSAGCKGKLALQIISRVFIINQSPVGRRRIQENETESKQEQNDKEQTIVVEILFQSL